eukprot:s824_g13.t1
MSKLSVTAFQAAGSLRLLRGDLRKVHHAPGASAKCSCSMWARYDQPTPAQKHAVPAALSGNDVMVAAQTGSGKTAAFLIPLIAETLIAGAHELEEGPIRPTAVVLAPTRELCQQITLEARKLCFRTPVTRQHLQRARIWNCQSSRRTLARAVAIYGGADALPQLKALAEGAEIVICTPGRLEDFLERGVISMTNVRYLVLDEADRMLDMGFEPQIRSIIEGRVGRGRDLSGHSMPESGGEEGRQTMMFSATFPREMQDLALDFLDPTYLWIGVGKVGEACENVVQRFQDASTTDLDGKFEMLVEAVKEVEVKSDGDDKYAKTLVFANSKTTVDAVCWRLSDARVRSMQIHGGLSQAARDRALADFRNGRVSVLVATDVAARGLDLPGVDHVVNYELPHNAEDESENRKLPPFTGEEVLVICASGLHPSDWPNWNTGISTSLVGSWEPALKEIIRSIQEMKTVEIPEWLEYKALGGGSAHSAGRGRGAYGYADRYNQRRSDNEDDGRFNPGYSRRGQGGDRQRFSNEGGRQRLTKTKERRGRPPLRKGNRQRGEDLPPWARGLPPRQRMR